MGYVENEDGELVWSYEEPYVGMSPNYKRECPFCGSRDVDFKGDHGVSVFRCMERSCGAVVRFEQRAPHAWAHHVGPAGSIARWNRRGGVDAE